MRTIYRRLIFEINRLQGIIKENKLDIRWINELDSIKNTIPVNETAKKRRIFTKKAIQPDDMELFSLQKKRYIDVQKLVCDDIGRAILTLKNKNIVENRECISFLEKIENKISCPEKYINIDNIMSKLDISDAKELLRQYIDVLENTSVDFEEKRKFESIIYEQLMHQPNDIFHIIDEEIYNQQYYLKLRTDSLTDIEKKCKKELSEDYEQFIKSTVLKEIINFANSQIIRPWNQIYHHETFFDEFTEEKICISFACNTIINVKLKTMPVFLTQNPEWIKHSETYIASLEENFKKIFSQYTKNYINESIIKCLKEKQDIIGRKKDKLFQYESELKENIIFWEKLINQLKLQVQEMEEYYSNIKIKPVKTNKNRFNNARITKKYGNRISALLLFAIIIIMGVVYREKKNKDFVINNIEQSTENIKNVENIETTKNIDKTEDVKDMESTEIEEQGNSIAEKEETENVKIVENIETIQNIDKTEVVEDTEFTKTREQGSNIAEKEETENVKIVENIEVTQSVDKTETMENTESTQTSKTIETTEETESIMIVKEENTETEGQDNHVVTEQKTDLDIDIQNEESNFYILPEGSTRYLTETDLSELDEKTLRLARNEIFARHGRLFKTEDLNSYFSEQPWYYGYLSMEEFDDSVLNHYEKANLDLIKNLEHDIAVAKEAATLSIYIQNSGDNTYILPESNSRYLSVEDLNGLDKETLRLARNEIFARHGRLFQSEDLNNYFNKQPWYYGYLSMEEFDDSVFNNYEKTNLDLIKSFENQQNSEK